jgi:hypothetical protein
MPAECVPLGVHLDPLGAEERAIWDRYVELVEAAGPSEMIVTESRIAFRAPHRIFTGGSSRRAALSSSLTYRSLFPSASRTTGSGPSGSSQGPFGFTA